MSATLTIDLVASRRSSRWGCSAAPCALVRGKSTLNVQTVEQVHSRDSLRSRMSFRRRTDTAAAGAALERVVHQRRRPELDLRGAFHVAEGLDLSTGHGKHK